MNLLKIFSNIVIYSTSTVQLNISIIVKTTAKTTAK